jgi:DinB superfamily
MELNPYARFIAGRDPIEILESTYVQLAKLTDRLPEDQLALRSPSGKWSAREIVAHLADCELVFGFRLRQTLAEDHPTLQPFDQDRWASRYVNCDMDSALRLFAATRGWNLLLVNGVSGAERSRPVTHPERGTMTLWTIVETMAGHDVNHLRQIERLAGPRTS